MHRRRLGLFLVAAVAVGGCARSSPRAQRRLGPPSTASSSSSSTAVTTTTSTYRPVAAQPATATCPAIPQRAAPDPNRPRYVLDVHIDPAGGQVDGQLSVHFVPDLPTDRLVFRLWPNGPRPAAGGGRLDTGPVSVGSRPAAATKPDATTLVVSATVAAGEAVDVAMPFHLTLPGAIDDRVAKVGDTLRLGSFFPILAWEPGVGWATEPAVSGFAEASTAPTADFRVSIALPPGYDVLGTGTPDDGGGWTAFAVRDFALSVGHFAEASAVARAPQPVTVTVGVARGIGESPQTYVNRIVAVLEAHATRFGPYPWNAYSVAITGGLKGGIEYPMHVMQGPGTLGRTTSHEAGHQWFYGLVGDDQGRDPFLDEGLATYAEGRFEGTVSSFLARTIPPGGKGRVGAPMTYWEPRQSIYYPSVYLQGSNAVAALGRLDAVDCALRLFVARNAYRIATPGDLVSAMSAVFPDAANRMAAFGVHP